MVKKLKLAVLISGRGSNLQAIIDACATPDFPAEIALVISNKPDAQGLIHAEIAEIKTGIIDHKLYKTREEFDRELDAQITESGAELVCLAGFMRLLTGWFTKKWQGKLINIHPSLLPEFKGLDTHKRVLAADVKTTGCTVHFVTEEMDDGPVILQKQVTVRDGDTEELLANRVLEAEHKCYPEAIRKVAEDLL